MKTHVQQVVIEDSGNRQWYPGEIVQSHYSFKVPEGMEEGTYLLKFKLKDTHNGPRRDIFLAIDKSALDEDHYINLGQVMVTR